LQGGNIAKEKNRYRRPRLVMAGLKARSAVLPVIVIAGSSPAMTIERTTQTKTPAEAGVFYFREDVDAGGIGKRSDAVLRTAMPGHDARN
jgi:hypothetical protein